MFVARINHQDAGLISQIIPENSERTRTRFNRHRSILRSIFFLSLFLMTPLTAHANSHIYRSTLNSTAFILGQGSDGVSSGTGAVVNKNAGLVLTSYHVIGDAKKISVVFPSFSNGQVIGDWSYYVTNSAELIHSAKAVLTDPTRDLALLQVERVPAHTQSIQLAPRGAQPGETVHTVGNSGAGAASLWRYGWGRVRQAFFQRSGRGDGYVQARVIETTLPLNPGDSGGPTVNDRGQLVAVNFAMITGDNLISYGIDISEVHAFLARFRPSPTDNSTSGRNEVSEAGTGSPTQSDTSNPTATDLRSGLVNRYWQAQFKSQADHDKGASKLLTMLFYPSGVVRLAVTNPGERIEPKHIAQATFSLQDSRLMIVGDDDFKFGGIVNMASADAFSLTTNSSLGTLHFVLVGKLDDSQAKQPPSSSEEATKPTQPSPQQPSQPHTGDSAQDESAPSDTNVRSVLIRGAWLCKVPQSAQQPREIYWITEFHADGTFTEMLVDADLNQIPNTVVTGTYTLSGSQLTMYSGNKLHWTSKVVVRAPAFIYYVRDCGQQLAAVRITQSASRTQAAGGCRTRRRRRCR